MVKAPFKTPVRKATPPLQPVSFWKSVHTKLDLACDEGIAARTMIVTIPPIVTMKRPKCCRYGKMPLKKMVTETHSIVINSNPTKMFQDWMT